MDDNLLIFKQHPDFVILPEYYNVDPLRRDTLRNSHDAYKWLDYCRTLSDRFNTTLIAGTAVEAAGKRFYNTCSVFSHGRAMATYRKRHPTVNERKNSISPGQEHVLFEIDGVFISVLICADVLQPSNFDALRPLGPDLVFIPTTSPYKPDETLRDKMSRDKDIFMDGARRSGSYVIKCCAVGRLWGGRLQGRSLVAAPWSVITRIPPDEEDRRRILSVVVDISELREFRTKQDRLHSAGH